MIPHSKPSITDDDAERVARVVRSGQLAQGPEVAALERELAARLRVQDAAAVASGSAALELALGALGVGAGDEVLIASYVCDALYHAVRRVGATPVLVDADAATLSLSAKDALARRTSRTRAVIVPHAFGLAADLEPFQALEVPVIEDCAQALGAELDDGRPAGSRGALAVCSFYATKMIAAGEGGAVAGPAALARGQLARLDAFIARRRALAARYRTGLASAPARLPTDAGRRHVYHRFVLGLDCAPDAVIEALATRGVAARRPVFRPAHRALGLDGFPEADRLWAESLSIPCYPALTDDDAERVLRAVAAVLASAAEGNQSR